MILKRSLDCVCLSDRSSCLFSLNFCNPSKTAGQEVRLAPGARTDRCAAQCGADLNRSRSEDGRWADMTYVLGV